MKTVRFTRVVEKCGRPHVHALWVAPEKDPEFTRARKADRVMTIGHAERGQTDAGHVGYHPASGSGDQFLVFPKSLKRFEAARVVGIKFDLIEQPRLETAKGVAPARPTHPPPGKAKPRSTPARDRREEAAKMHSDAKRRRRMHPPAKTTPPAEPRRHATDIASESHNGSESPLLRQVRHALRELEEGKSVAAYRRLDRAAKAEDAR